MQLFGAVRQIVHPTGSNASVEWQVKGMYLRVGVDVLFHVSLLVPSAAMTVSCKTDSRSATECCSHGNARMHTPTRECVPRQYDIGIRQCYQPLDSVQSKVATVDLHHIAIASADMMQS